MELKNYDAATTAIDRMIRLWPQRAENYTMKAQVAMQQTDTVAALADSLMDDFLAKRIDHVEIVYNQFKNSLSQILTTEQFLPVAAKERTGSKDHKNTSNDYIFEPSKEEILREMIPLTLRST
ncbi:MAG: F0F1 ATP synthase subunit gamma, partial [Elusimicrobiaceae bacterium]|nr:F0F1 ATP synthase subunit gamma [Elusimicrobiaceae bacterium]